jgi:hypothetical protein
MFKIMNISKGHKETEILLFRSKSVIEFNLSILLTTTRDLKIPILFN